MSEIVAQIVTKGSDRAEKQTTLVRKSNLRKAVKDIDTTVQSIVKASADYKADRAQTSADRIVKSCKAFMVKKKIMLKKKKIFFSWCLEKDILFCEIF